MKLRILHVVEALGIGGGIENGIANLIARMDPCRFEHVLCAVFRVGDLVDRYPNDRVRITCLEQAPRRLSTQVGALTRAIREVQPHVVHSRNWGALEAVIAARVVRTCSVVHSEHGVEIDSAMEPRRRNVARRVAFELADRVFCVSGELRSSLSRRTGFAATRISVVHNGVDTRRFRPEPKERQTFREELGISSDDFCIGCLGRLSPVKDYMTVLRAVELLDASAIPWRLLIAGEGEELRRLQEFVNDRSGIRRRTRFLGATARVPAFLNGLDAYVLPSLCEGISNSLLEAMATHLPVIASDTGGNPEIVTHERSGLLFPVRDFRSLAEHLLRLRSDPVLRERLRQDAAARARDHFSLDTMVENYQTLYTDLARLRQPMTTARGESMAATTMTSDR